MPVAINFEEALENLNSNNGSGGDFERVSYIPRGSTQVLFVQDERGFDPEEDNPLTTLGVETWNYFSGSNNPWQKHYITFVVVLDTSEDSKLPATCVNDPNIDPQLKQQLEEAGAEYRVIPLLTKVTAYNDLLEQLKADWELSYFDEDGNFVAGDVFVISKSGHGKEGTKYSVTAAHPKKAPDTPNNVLMPSKTISEVAAEYQDWQKSRAEEDGSGMQEADESSFS